MLSLIRKPVIFISSIFFLVTFIALFFLEAFADKAILLDSPKVRLMISPGKAKAGRIEVKNPEDQPKQVKIYIEDWAYTGEAGEKKFIPPGTAELSCSNWITYAPAEFTVPPHGKQFVNYTVKVPEDAQGGHYAVLFFESLMNQSADKTEAMVSMPVAIRIGSLFYIEAEGTVKRAVSIEKLSLERKSNAEPLTINLELKNSGNVDIICGGNYNLMDNEGKVFARGELKSNLYLFPGDSGKLTASWKEEVPQGSYDLIFTLDLGGALEELGLGRGPIITREASVEIGKNGEVVSVGELK